MVIKDNIHFQSGDRQILTTNFAEDCGLQVLFAYVFHWAGFNPRGLEYSDVRWHESYIQMGSTVFHLTHDYWKLHPV